jgi:hypothetical protein
MLFVKSIEISFEANLHGNGKMKVAPALLEQNFERGFITDR